MHENYSRAIDAELRVTTLSRLDACGLLPATVETMCLRQYMQAIEGSCDGVATNRGTWINPLRSMPQLLDALGIAKEPVE